MYVNTIINRQMKEANKASSQALQSVEDEPVTAAAWAQGAAAWGPGVGDAWELRTNCGHCSLAAWRRARGKELLHVLGAGGRTSRRREEQAAQKKWATLLREREKKAVATRLGSFSSPPVHDIYIGNLMGLLRLTQNPPSPQKLFGLGN